MKARGLQGLDFTKFLFYFSALLKIISFKLKNIKGGKIMGFTGHEEHNISFEVAAEFTSNYRDQRSSPGRKGGFFGRDAIEALLAQDDCVGIRYYYGLTSDDEQVLILVGTDANENDLTGEGDGCMEISIPCPDRCGSNNMLNS
jgi:hypothetical protein